MNNKSDVLEIFVKFKAEIESKIKRKIVELQTDNGGEFIALTSFYKRKEFIIDDRVMLINKWGLMRDDIDM